MNIKSAPIGTRIFYVAGRFWETQEPETGHIAEELPDDSENIYAFHDGFGHNVYLRADRAFLTRDDAVAEALRLKEEKEAQNEAEFEVFWNKLVSDMGWPDLTPDKS